MYVIGVLSKELLVCERVVLEIPNVWKYLHWDYCQRKDADVKGDFVL